MVNLVSPPASLRNIAASFDRGPTRASAARQGPAPQRASNLSSYFVDNTRPAWRSLLFSKVGMRNGIFEGLEA